MKRRHILTIGLTLAVVLTFLLPNTETVVTVVGEIENPRSDSITLEYDHNGNLLNDGQNLYTYNVNNNLIEIENQDTGEITSFTYGPLGNRVSSTQHNVTTHHLYNGVDEIQERMSDGSLLREYIPGVTGQLALVDYTDLGSYPAGESEVLYYFQDVLGSTVALTDVFSNVVEQYYYEPYGETIITDDSGQNQLFASAFGNPFMWTGQRYDSVNDLYHFPARSYSPYLGRFLQRDPLGHIDGMNLYEYGKSSPLVFVDPLGLDSRVNTLMVPSWEFLENLIKWGGRTPEEASDEVIDLTYGSAILTLDWGSMIIPGIADARDVGEVVSLHDFSTGERLDSVQWRITVLAGMFPLIPARGARKGVALLDDLGTYHHHSGGMGGGGLGGGGLGKGGLGGSGDDPLRIPERLNYIEGVDLGIRTDRGRGVFDIFTFSHEGKVGARAILDPPRRIQGAYATRSTLTIVDQHSLSGIMQVGPINTLSQAVITGEDLARHNILRGFDECFHEVHVLSGIDIFDLRRTNLELRNVNRYMEYLGYTTGRIIRGQQFDDGSSEVVTSVFYKWIRKPGGIGGGFSHSTNPP